jgi:O-antigen ligase
LAIAVGVAACSIALCRVAFSEKTYRLPEKLLLAEIASDISANTKKKAWLLSLPLIKQNPMWGVGVDQFPKCYKAAYCNLDTAREGIDPEMNINASNSFLSYMVEVGALPAAFLFGLILVVLCECFKDGHIVENLPLLVGFLAICVWALPADYLKERAFWIAFGMLSGSCDRKDRLGGIRVLPQKAASS